MIKKKHSSHLGAPARSGEVELQPFCYIFMLDCLFDGAKQ